ncbi:hypothetical protein B296_00048887 [Ensete ventricosum]|uniref:Uncharacterized protein n=1 Tax=Ensete ventricosum TaxID=4639 RepID=A0A426XRD5_ENSVE|nr:hypothetical protein B296_00048887 [Ensete ventricosum]
MSRGAREGRETSISIFGVIGRRGVRRRSKGACRIEGEEEVFDRGGGGRERERETGRWQADVLNARRLMEEAGDVGVGDWDNKQEKWGPRTLSN